MKMEKYFTAEEARNISEYAHNDKMNHELDEVYDKINSCMLRGDCSFTINKFLMTSTENFLKNKGFTVKRFSGCQWDPATDTTISW